MYKSCCIYRWRKVIKNLKTDWLYCVYHYFNIIWITHWKQVNLSILPSTNTSHTILSKPPVAFSHSHSRNNGQRFSGERGMHPVTMNIISPCKDTDWAGNRTSDHQSSNPVCYWLCSAQPEWWLHNLHAFFRLIMELSYENELNSE